jgi:hypothetical protein
MTTNNLKNKLARNEIWWMTNCKFIEEKILL